jgi:hypothetical protein
LSAFLAKDSQVRLALRKVHLIYLLRDAIYPLIERTSEAEATLAVGGLPESYKYLREFAVNATRYRLAYGIVLLPSLRSKYGAVPGQLRQDGLSFIDLSALRNEFNEGEFRASQFDTHPSARVHNRIAAALAPHILQNYFPTTQDR